ncbi:EscT/YscT/HrcT family type III secretion system export apparatus protein [Bradyrhizobium ottawaense]|uniref:type III secretion system export apparatus subunit SctT n=1 Tax=Bradyrhizobium TaxID=374 RepID=UPI000BE9A183|nr:MULTISPECIES: type III secretion system export apparatus subunit SctT [Bradyrhizobium]MDA9391579.1 translocation protein [Bradyrhizobium sp. CCBAU 45394]MDA9490063.1 translocation protein [Bradyrhizobium sp. CCBAU 11361]MDA9535799.1 translocation protein [Bradyrhizobium sp. CCBAU 21362]PDT64413.1 EscT/YscT/HrcT family type III secretion system export apparatus protein [Bradyrhizobium ottawaense]QHP67857.1 EscT/YscT/HrcT family type III secretion system export apparatus protein [Bradyrhizobi
MAGLSPTDAQAVVQSAIELVAATALSASRALGIMLVLPVFTRPRISGLIRGSLTIAIGLPCLAQVKLGLQALDPNTRLVSVTLLGLKEVFVGLVLGILLSIPLWSIQAVGDIIDTQRGISSQIAGEDPATHSQASGTGLFLGITAVTIFVLVGGLQTMVKSLYGSYLVWPVYQFLPAVTSQGAMECLALLDHIMLTTLLVAGPVLALLLLIDISVMMLGRFASQLKMNDLSPMIKNVAFGIIMVSYTVYLLEYAEAEILNSDSMLDYLKKLLK